MKKLLGTILFVPMFILAQNSNYKNIDSLSALIPAQKLDTTKAHLYNQISYYYIYQNADSGIAYAKKGLAISEKLNWQMGIGNAYLQMGSHYTSKGLYDSSLQCFDLAIKNFSTRNDLFFIGKVYNQLGIVNGNKGNYVVALEFFFKALNIFESSKNSTVNSSLAGVYENIGTIYNFTDSYDKAIYYLEKGIAELKKISYTQTKIALNYINIGTVYQKQNKYDAAIQAFKKANVILADQTDYFAISFLNSSWAKTYLYDKNYKLSIEKNEIALHAAALSGDNELMTSIQQNLGYAQFKAGSEASDEKLSLTGFGNLSKSLMLYKKLQNQEGLRISYQYLSEYYSYRKDFKNAFLMHQQFSNYSDSIFNLKNKQSLQNLEDQRTIDLNKKEIELNKLNIANKERQKWFYLSAVLFLTCIGGLLFYQSRNRKRTNVQLQQLNENLDEANKTKTRFFSILNHDLRSPVSNLIQFLHLQKESPEIFDEETKTRLQQKTISGVENLLASMEDILLWSKGQMSNFKPVLQSFAVQELFADTQKHFESFNQVNIIFEDSNLQIITDENYLKTILRNFTANAIKALENTADGTIVWKAFQNNNKTFLSITDNGPGASQQQLRALYDDKEVVGIKTGLGLHLIRDLAMAVNIKITALPNDGKGTTFILEM